MCVRGARTYQRHPGRRSSSDRVNNGRLGLTEEEKTLIVQGIINDWILGGRVRVAYFFHNRFLSELKLSVEKSEEVWFHVDYPVVVGLIK